jgi:hypothetical protein
MNKQEMCQTQEFKDLVKQFLIEEAYGACDIELHLRNHGLCFKERASDEEIEIRLVNFIDRIKKSSKCSHHGESNHSSRSMIDNRVERDKHEFSLGFIAACAVILQSHGEDTIVEDALRCNSLTVDEMREIGVDEHDIEILMPVLKEIERKGRLS